jgi:hypothetical protein
MTEKEDNQLSDIYKKPNNLFLISLLTLQDFGID